MKRIFISLLILLIVFLTGCGSKESRVIGKWHGNGAVFEFFSDKTFTMNPESGTGENFTGTWTILSDGRLKADVNMILTKSVILGEFSGNTLKIDINGTKGTLKRVNAKTGFWNTIWTLLKFIIP
jgi:hypothetical protein